MFIVEHPVTALIIALGVLLAFKIIFAISNALEKYISSKKKSEPVKADKKPTEDKKEAVKSSEEKPKETQEKSVSSTQKTTSSNENYLYDRFVVSPTRDDETKSCDKICSAFLEDKEAVDIKNKKLEIKVEPIEEEKSKRVYEILSRYEDKDKLLDDFSSMPREMKLLILENILKKM